MELSKKTKEYWEENDWVDLEKSQNIKDLYIIAERVINRMPKPIVQVCGPIGTGGLGSVEKNLNAFNDTIINLQNDGLIVFDQMPFEEPMQKFKEKIPKGEYLESILTDFYLPIIESGLISKFYFMNGWESSHGANWEYKEAQRLGIPVIYL